MLGRNIRSPRRMLPPGESRWVRWRERKIDRQTDWRQTVTLRWNRWVTATRNLNMGWQCWPGPNLRFKLPWCWRYPGAMLCRYVNIILVLGHTLRFGRRPRKMSLPASGIWLPVMRNFLKSIKCWLFSETGCTRKHYWTAGQRIDPNRNSTFVWRVNPNSDIVTVMTYVNWQPGELNGGQWEFCMNLFGGHSCTWNDESCNTALCSVCEIDVNTWSNITAMRSKCSTYDTIRYDTIR